MGVCGLGFATIQERLLQELQYNEQHTFWHLNNGAEFGEKNKYDILVFLFLPSNAYHLFVTLKRLNFNWTQIYK